VATPLALVLTELLHNAVQHGLFTRRLTGTLELIADRTSDWLMGDGSLTTAKPR
jgi:two-component sensor histidine kinase